MPRFLRWHIVLESCRVYLYITTCICVIICAYMIMQSFFAYKAYKEKRINYATFISSEEYKDIENKYDALKIKRQQLLRQSSTINTQSITLTLLDTAMMNSQDIRLRQIIFSEDRFSVDGIASTEEAYQEYMNYVRSRLQGWNCNGKQEVEKDSQHQLFHLDGHTKKSVKEDSVALQS